jgi:hypothetical protein
LTDGLLIDPDASQHLVLDLDEVVGVEKIALLEQKIRDLLRPWVPASLLPEGIALARVGLLGRQFAAYIV